MPTSQGKRGGQPATVAGPSGTPALPFYATGRCPPPPPAPRTELVGGPGQFEPGPQPDALTRLVNQGALQGDSEAGRRAAREHPGARGSGFALSDDRPARRTHPGSGSPPPGRPPAPRP